jgi:hypothetical protein
MQKSVSQALRIGDELKRGQSHLLCHLAIPTFHGSQPDDWSILDALFCGFFHDNREILCMPGPIATLSYLPRPTVGLLS